MRRFPIIRQHDSMDCGPSCLRIISKFYGVDHSLEELRDMCYISREGVSLMGISEAAGKIGFRTVGVKITFDQLCNKAELPCIVHWNQNHFVVVYKISRRGKRVIVHVSDPALGLLRYSKEQFLQSWVSIPNGSGEAAGENGLGIALLLTPMPAFYEKGGKKERSHYGLSDMLSYLKPYKRYIAQVLFAMLTGSVISLILPFLTQSVIDVGIGSGNLHFVVIVLIAQFVLIFGQLINDLLRSWLMLHMTTRISISLISNFLSKLMRLPISFFDTKQTGDIMQRIGDHSRIQSFLTGSLLSIVMAIVTLVVYSLIMGWYDFKILVVFLVGSTLYTLWVLLFLRQRRKIDYMRFQASSANQSNIVQLINGMQEIKLNGCENQKRWEWEHIQAKLFKVSVKGLSLGQIQQIGGTFIDQSKNILISFMTASFVIDGGMTLGMMMAVQYIIGQLNAPISQLIRFIQETQDAKISMERLWEIHRKDDEELSGRSYIRKIPDGADIEFRDVSFGYNGPKSAMVLKDVNIRIPYNKMTAIVGSSGSGKTTMIKMMLGFYRPMQGEVLLGGESVSDYSQTEWRRNCGTVMQEGFIFSDSIARNIGVSDVVPDMKRVRASAKTANIDGFVDGLPLGYNTKIGAEGNGISMGQKQRLLIARAVYKDAKYLFLDEATNSLDTENERTIMENLSKVFKNRTVVVIAHRLSTVKNADNIIVLDKGRVVEQGTHSELTNRRGYYYNLVKNQLELGN